MAGKKKVVVAMSGGVDSSVTAALLLEEGYDVAGVSLRLWECQREAPQNCSDYLGAKRVTALLGIPHTLLDLRPQFVKSVVRPFAQSYLQGRTPNPCVACNSDFKLGLLMKWAKAGGADYVATGHYARLVRDLPAGRASLLRGVDRKKDQSYFLFALSRSQLDHTLFPLGDLVKEEVRQRARHFGLPVADRPESQDICFGDYRALVESVAGEEKIIGGGEIVDRLGNLLGRHQGIHRLTVGQRKGLGVSSSEPLYVLEIDPARSRVVVGTREELGSAGLVADGMNWIEPPEEEEIAAEVQLRYRSTSVPCLAKLRPDGKCEVRFQAVFPPVTPGQAAVFYRGERVLGGGWIERAIKLPLPKA